MKIVVDTDVIPLYKLNINSKGEIELTVHGYNQKFEGQLTVEEQEQIGFRVLQMTKGVVSFDPEPQDLIARHGTDILTLEEQQNILVELREQFQNKEGIYQTLAIEYQKYRQDHEATDETLAALRTRIKNLEMDLHEANGKVQMLESVHTPAAEKPAEASA